MTVATPRARKAAPPARSPRRAVAAGGRRTVFNSPNRRRELARVAVWSLVAGAAVLVPYLVL